MPARLFLSSGDLLADRRYEFARDLQLKGDLAAAADLLEQAIELAPNFTSAWFTLGEIREQLGEREAAIAAFRRARETDPEDRHGAAVRLMRLGADQLGEMPKGYVQTLFDQYAPRFEAALLGDLDYRAPQLSVQGRDLGTQWRRRSPPSSSARSISAAAPGSARRLRERGRPFHRHRSVAGHDRAGARHRALCRARSRRHGRGPACEAGCQRQPPAGRGRHVLRRRYRADAGRSQARARARRRVRVHAGNPSRATAS